MQRIVPLLVALSAIVPACDGAVAAEIHYGVSFEPSVAPDGAVSVVIRNLSKVPVTLRGLTVAVPGAAPCAGAAAPITVEPGGVATHAATCHAQTERRLLKPLSEAVERPAAAAAQPGLTLGATLDRLGQSHEVKAGWSAEAP